MQGLNTQNWFPRKQQWPPAQYSNFFQLPCFYSVSDFQWFNGNPCYLVFCHTSDSVSSIKNCFLRNCSSWGREQNAFMKSHTQWFQHPNQTMHKFLLRKPKHRWNVSVITPRGPCVLQLLLFLSHFIRKQFLLKVFETQREITWWDLSTSVIHEGRQNFINRYHCHKSLLISSSTTYEVVGSILQMFRSKGILHWYKSSLKKFKKNRYYLSWAVKHKMEPDQFKQSREDKRLIHKVKT
jgi:hypothetical protein